MIEVTTGQVLAGSLPPVQQRLIRRWTDLHRPELDKVVLTQRNQIRAVLIAPERYSQLERHPP